MSSEELSYAELQTWRIDALKDYCRKRNVKVSGTKAELVARVFARAASEMRIPIEPTAEERMAQTEGERTKLLKMPAELFCRILCSRQRDE